jgi:hypothetical protein
LLGERPPWLGHTLGDRVINKFEFDGFILKGLWHGHLASFKYAFVAAEKRANLRLDGGWQVRIDVNGSDVMGNSKGSLTFVRLPPRSESPLPDVAHQGLSLGQSMLIDADSEDAEAGDAETHIAGAGQLRRDGNKCGQADHLPFVQELQCPFFGKSRFADGTTDIVHDDIVDVVKQHRQGQIDI